MSEFGVEAFGLTTSVGLDARTTAASIRSGIARRSPITHIEAASLDSTAGTSPSGSAIAGLTDGYAGYARWGKMLRLAVADMKRAYASLQAQADGFWEQCAVLFVLPEDDSSRFVSEPAGDTDMVMQRLVTPLLRLFSPAVTLDQVHIVRGGHSGFALALHQAAALAANAGCNQILLLAVDAYLDLPSLAWLIGDDRLKTDEQQHGLVPGEAAAVMLLDPTGGSAESVARIAGVAVEQASVDDIQAEHEHGRVIARCVQQSVGDGSPLRCDVYSDLNGEYWRAYEYGAAKVNMPAGLLDQTAEWYPASSVGDTGAVSAALATILAQRAFARKYAIGDRALVISQSDSGRASSFFVFPGERHG